MKKIFLILGLLLIALVLFVPLIFKFLAPLATKPQSGSEEPVITKSEKVPVEIPEEEKCLNDADCGINICECRALNKNYVASKDKICARYCPGEPICYKGRCIFKGEEDKFRLQVEP